MVLATTAYSRALSWVSELDTLTVNSVSGATLSVTITVLRTGVVLSNTYTPNASKSVSVYGLADLIRPCLKTSQQSDMVVLKLTDAATTVTYTTRAYYLRGRCASLPATFFNLKFASGLTGDKITYPGMMEYVWVLRPHDGLGPYQSYVIAQYISGGKVFEKHFPKQTITDPTTDTAWVIPIPANPDLYKDSILGYPVSYTVRAGDRRQRFVVSARRGSPLGFFSFFNRFNVMETFAILGEITETPEVDRKSVETFAGFSVYDAEEYTVYKVKTGALQESEKQLLFDLLSSPSVLLYRNGRSVQVAVTDHKIEWTTDHTAVNNAEITLRATLPGGLIEMGPTIPDRLFDSTFDPTFE